MELRQQLSSGVKTATRYSGAMTQARNLIIFVVALLVLRRFGIQVSIVGSLLLTVGLSLLIGRLDRTKQ